MNEEHFRIATPDNKSIHGVLSKPEEETLRLVILAHGLTGNPFEHLHMVAREEFLDNGYAVCQFWFYHEAEDARKLHECSLQLHARDIQNVVSYFKDSFSDIYLCGHSYGGLSAIICNSPDLKALSLWDPSFKPWAEFWPDCLLEKIHDYNGYLVTGHFLGLVGKIMVEEAKALSSSESEAYARELKTPCQLILADRSKNAIQNDLKDYLIMPEREVIEIAGADHCFIEEQTAYDLAEAAREWFDRF